MRTNRFLLILLLLSVCFSSFGQKRNDLTTSRILILLDRSSSMVEPWSAHKERYQAADSIIKSLMDSLYKVNPEVEFSLRVFGHQHTVPENNCYDTKNEVRFSKDNRTQMALRLADIHPLGVTPIAYALQQAAENDLIDEQHNAYSIILITDGGESCGGNICDVVKNLIQHKVYFKPYIVSLVDYSPLKTEYECLGEYLQVTTEKDIKPAVGKIVEAYRPMLNMTKEDYKQIQTILANPPSVLKVNIPPVNIPEQEPVIKKPEPVVVKQQEPEPIPAPKLNRENIAALTYKRPVVVPLTETAIFLKKVPVPIVPAKEVELPPLQKDEITALNNNNAITIRPVISNDGALLKPVIVPTVPAKEVELPPLQKDDIKLIGTGAIKTMGQVTNNNNNILLKPVKVPVVPAREIELPPLQKDNINAIAYGNAKEITMPVTGRSLKPVRVEAVPARAPEPLEKETIGKINTGNINTVTVAWTPKPIKKVSVPAVPERAPEPLMQDAIAAIPIARALKMPTLFLQDEIIKKVKVPTVPPHKADDQPTPVVVAPTQPKPVVTTPKKPTTPKTTEKEVKTVVHNEDAGETLVEVYFTDGKGKYYNSTPEVQLKNPQTGEVVKKFHRTIDANNNPDPQKNIQPGTYDLTLPGGSNIVMHNVVIEKNKRAKIEVVVTAGSLKFEYEGNPTRPVTEFIAVVNEPFSEGGKVVHQKCTEELPYEPGNYHIKINTEPVFQKNADLDFGSETVIYIPEPGFIQFTNQNPVGKVYLYCVLGDEFVRWMSMPITGNPASQKLRLRPGKYQAHYIKDAGLPISKEIVETFFIKSNETTELELK